MTYRCTETETASGICHTFHGPGIVPYANGLHLLKAHESERVLHLLHRAYVAGMEDKETEMRRTLCGEGS